MVQGFQLSGNFLVSRKSFPQHRRDDSDPVSCLPIRRWRTREQQRNSEMNHPVAKALSLHSPSRFRYSICTLISDPAEYRAMVDSFIAAGFDPSWSEYLYLDNTAATTADAYQGCNAFLNSAQGDYIILCHQDVRLNQDRLEQLEACIREMDQRDPAWALLGNAGGVREGEIAICLSDPGGKYNSGSFPKQVQSLDENFILARRSANLSLSHDLSGFHLYGTDLCVVARLLGRTAWVINFALHHKSRGTTGFDFIQARQQLIAKYSRTRLAAYVQTPCTTVSVCNSDWAGERATFKFLYDIGKGRYAQARSADFEHALRESLGHKYALHWVCYKLGRPWQNLKAFLAKSRGRK